MADSGDGRPGAQDLVPKTLSIDLGGSKLKAAVLDACGRMLGKRVRVPTPYPCTPERLLHEIEALVRPLPLAPRVSVGFPGMVREGLVRSATAYSREVKDGPPSDRRRAAWDRYPLEEALAQRLQRPVRLANDADVQGCAVVSGKGLEAVLTLGTGCGTALFQDGHLLPHLELSHGPFRHATFDLLLGSASRKRNGKARWSRWVHETLGWFDAMLLYDRLYLGGGNAKHVRGQLPERVTQVSNLAGILGGAWLWERGDGGPAAGPGPVRIEGSNAAVSR